MLTFVDLFSIVWPARDLALRLPLLIHTRLVGQTTRRVTVRHPMRVWYKDDGCEMKKTTERLRDEKDRAKLRDENGKERLRDEKGRAKLGDEKENGPVGRLSLPVHDQLPHLLIMWQSGPTGFTPPTRICL